MPIYCINLKHRHDRKVHSLHEFTTMGFTEKVIYLPFTKDVRGGVYGCFDSHIKIWKDFLIRFPNHKYAMVFEDDFVFSSKDSSILKKASGFVEKHYHEVDVLFLHPYSVNVEHSLNNQHFSHGYGFGTHAYIITRHYMEGMIRHGKLPEPNGRHIDFEMNFNFLDKKNQLYSEKMFYTKDSCFSQLADKSDNYLNTLDKFFCFDVNKKLDVPLAVVRFLKKQKLITDVKAKKIGCFLYTRFID